jgi:hypothetical protein
MSTKRHYTAAYRAKNGNVIPVGTDNIKPEYVTDALLDWRRDDPDGTYFIAYRDVPDWTPMPGAEVDSMDLPLYEHELFSSGPTNGECRCRCGEHFASHKDLDAHVASVPREVRS